MPQGAARRPAPHCARLRKPMAYLLAHLLAGWLADLLAHLAGWLTSVARGQSMVPSKTK